MRKMREPPVAAEIPVKIMHMRKRISISDLRIGMFIEEFCGSWMDHPFWRAHFVVESVNDLERIHDSGIREVWIDVSKGLDVESEQIAVANLEDAEAEVEQQLKNVAASAAPRARREADKTGELEHAAKIIADSRQVVADMFGEAHLGSVRSTDDAATVVDNIANSVARHPAAMIGLVRLKSADDYTFMHSVAVCALMSALARTLELDEAQIRDAGMAGLLHDIGKAQIPLTVLNKPGTLDDEEWKTMRSHPERGLAILRGARGVTPTALDAVLHHHEKVDGSGYPHHLAAEQIALVAKMCSVCDVYDAITSDRPYKAGWQPTIALRKMTEWASGHFDDTIFKAFVKTVGIYPIGSLVRLESQRLAVVVENDPVHLLQPTVKAFFSLRSKMHIAPSLIKLGGKGSEDRIVGYEDPATHGLTRVDELWLPPGAKAA